MRSAHLRSAAGRSAPRPRDERGSAVVDFVLVSMLVVPLFLGILQVGLYLYVRNTVTAAASEGATMRQCSNRGPADGESRTRELVSGVVRDQLIDIGVRLGDRRRRTAGSAGRGQGAHATTRSLGPRDRLQYRRARREGNRRMSTWWIFGRRDERGSAVVEFSWLAILLMVPLVYVMLAVFDVQRARTARPRRPGGGARVHHRAGPGCRRTTHGAGRSRRRAWR